MIKIFLSLNFRRDGLSALSPSNRYGNFGGGSLAWDLSKEHFLAEIFQVNGSINLN